MRSQGIDALRAYFALWVLLAHAIPWAHYHQGETLLLRAASIAQKLFQPTLEIHPAVLGFIVLSGYCIHKSGFRSVESYARRRFFRIAPVYVLGIAAGVAGFLISHSPMSATAELSIGCLAAKLTGLPTFYPALRECTFQGNGPLHTVMVEIWLYAAYPLLLGRWRLILAIWALGAVAVSFSADLWAWWNTASLPGFLLFWWIGAAAVHPEIQSWLRRHVGRIALCWLVLTLLVLAWRIAPLAELRKIPFALLMAWLIIALEGRRLPLAGLGLAGYSIYAFHAPITYSLLSAGVSVWATMVAAVAFGFLMYRLVEVPFMRWGTPRPNPVTAAR